VYPLTPGFAPDDLPQSRSASELLAHLPEELAEPAPLSDAQILGEVEERAWAAQFRLEDAIADQAKGSMEAEERLVDALAGGAAPPDLQTQHDTHQALYLLARGLRQHLGFSARPPGLGHFTVQGAASAEAAEAFRRVRAAFRDGDIGLLDRVVAYPLTVVMPSGAEIIVRDRDDLNAAQSTILAPALRSAVLSDSVEGMTASGDGFSLAGGRIVLRGGITRVDAR
jgi:hypothetical protein